MSELVSVVMPAYNCAGTIEESVSSVLQQSYTDFELLIVDDCSSDATPSILATLANSDRRVKVITHTHNMGVACARNTAIAYAMGTYIAFLDADDLWHPDKLRLQIEFMQVKNAVFSYTDYLVFKDLNGSREQLGQRSLPSMLDYYDLLQRGYTIGTLSVMLHREFLGERRFQKVGHEDFAMWVTLLRSRQVVAYKVPSEKYLANYRVSANSVSSSKIRAAKWMWAILSKQERLNLPRALYGFSRYAFRSVSRSL